MNFECLPDELLLQICRYLSSTDVLYSLFNLNSRLNRTIFTYRQHVTFRLTNFQQFEYICSVILPEISSTVRTLSINANWTDLVGKRFHYHFGHQMKDAFPNLEHLILIAFNGKELSDYMTCLSDLLYLKKLTIRDRYNTPEEIKQSLFEKVLSANDFRFEIISFNRHSESLKINSTNGVIYSNIIQLDVHLEEIHDLECLFNLIPNIQRMNVVIGKRAEEEEELELNQLIEMKYLVEFRIESFRRCWNFNELCYLISKMPFLRQLSLDLFTQDIRLTNGQEIYSILPESLQRFHFCTEYEPEEAVESTDEITCSWMSTPFSICCLFSSNKTQIFLHTIPYELPYLDMNSSFIKYLSKTTSNYHHRVEELLLFNVKQLSDVCMAIDCCQNIRDLAIEVDETLSDIEEKEEKKSVTLPRLKKLRWISIDGCPKEIHLLKEIISVSPNLLMFIVDMSYLVQLLVYEECLSLLTKRIRHLSIQLTTDKDLTDDWLEKVSNVFRRVKYLIVESKDSANLSTEHILLLFLRYFERNQLVSVIVRGLITEQLRNDPYQWLISNTYLRNSIGNFQAESIRMSLKKINDKDIFENIIDIGLRMYGNGYALPIDSVHYVLEYCRQQLRQFCVKHKELLIRRNSLLTTLIYSSRRNKTRLKRLQQYVQTKDRSLTQQEDLNDVKDKRLTISDRFHRISRQFHIHLDQNESFDLQRARQYSRLDTYYKSDQLTSDAYLTFVEQQHSSFNQIRSLSSMDILHWLNLYSFSLPKSSRSSEDLSLAEICLFLLKEILLNLMDKVYQCSTPCEIRDVLRRRHVQTFQHLPYSGRKRRNFH
ncbi:unnamed protein product [Adineta ricciae]|uniref:F-box domain-containing protein n=1 Tax=Adineta ricciae TaxID=249248 RepID=A0A814H3I1_ADIRI|nr:unnamed protein product [Adineta ricciae]CAF1608605.1 unnamed protein product [Adineta ricciae]